MMRPFIWAMLVVMIPSAKAADCTRLSQLDWLLGLWHMDGPNSQVAEHWQQVSDVSFEGRGTTTSKQHPGQTTSETMRLVEMSGEVFFLAKVPNNHLPIAFAAHSCEPGRVVFSNEGHDFPQYLAYQMTADGVLNVQVSSRSNPGFVLNYARQ